ncbi:MAG: molybdopterin-dependent oxidoreductase [Gammaproteobacteria bacterium]|jgi:anaerobic selenocysteine-containing dehydrogenase|nr:molybdopterin-dependent oxidoreductase [Gammaproteobacteria bacterium]
MNVLNRRQFIKFAMASSAAVAGAGVSRPALCGSVELQAGGRDFSPITQKERQAIPSACWQCVTRDAIVGYVEDGRLMKIEGHPDSIRTRGVLCAKGQAGVNQVYFPDRILYPMKRVGERGEGKWKRISWDEALDEIVSKIKPLRDQGHPEKFMFQYGRMKASSSVLIKDAFLGTYGTKTIGNHTAICEGGKWTSQELSWGGHYDNWDFDNTDFVLIFGSNVLETHTNHIPTAQRLIEAHVDRGVPVYTFDVRLTNTAAKSNEWIPIKVGADGAVALAMSHVIMAEGLYDEDFLKFVRVTPDHNASIGEKVEALKTHLAEYTPEWAESVSGVPAERIKDLAIQFGKAKSGVVVSYRGTIAHHHGSDQERAMQMLAALTGNINSPGGRCQGVGAGWSHPPHPEQPEGKGLPIIDGFPGQVAFPTHHASGMVLKMIKDGSMGRPDVYMWYCYQPVYSNGEMLENAEVLKSIPYLVCSTITYDESSSLADLILPDATYLERWDWEDMVSPKQIAEYYIRQPLVQPLGEARDFGDVCCDLAERMGFPLGYKSKEEFVRMSCDMTPGVKEAGGFEYMKKHGVWHDENAKPAYFGFKTQVAADELAADGVILDEATGVYWNWTKSKAKSKAEAKEKGYTHTPKAYKGYVAQRMPDGVYIGFKPDKVNKSGYLEFYSDLMKEKGLPEMPSYTPVPEHQEMAPEDLILTTYKVAVHTHSRTTHLKWLAEIYHDNPAWINPETAAERGIAAGDDIKVTSSVGEFTTKARVTEGIIPGVVAVSFHVGRSQSGRFASGNKSPLANDDDPDLKLIWWDKHGVHPNTAIPNTPDPISGQQRWMDTVVKVAKV